MDVTELHSACVAVFVERVRLVRDGQLALSTPCTEWTVRRLVNHMVAEELRGLLIAFGRDPDWAVIRAR